MQATSVLGIDVIIFMSSSFVVGGKLSEGPTPVEPWAMNSVVD